MERLLYIIILVVAYVWLRRLRHKGEHGVERGVSATEPPAVWLSYTRAEPRFKMAGQLTEWRETGKEAEGRQYENDAEGHNEHAVTIRINRKNITMENKYVDMSTLDMIEAICKALGCPFERDEENFADFTFQGEDFRIQTLHGTRYFNIMRVSWAEASLDDVDQVACLQRTINEVNMYAACVVVYTIDTEANVMHLHFRRHAVITPEMPAVEEYFKSLLMPFFSVEHDFVNEFQNMKKEMGLE